MAKIDIDTDSIRDFAINLKSNASTFEAKASSFSSGLSVPSNISTKIQNITEICKNISVNLNNISSYADDYASDVENAENTNGNDEYVLPEIYLPIPDIYRGVNTYGDGNKIRNFESPYNTLRESYALSNADIYNFLIDDREYSEKFKDLIDRISADAPVIKEACDYYGLVDDEAIREILKGNATILDYKYDIDPEKSSVGKQMLEMGYLKPDIRRLLVGEITNEELLEEIQNDPDQSRYRLLENYMFRSSDYYNELVNSEHYTDGQALKRIRQEIDASKLNDQICTLKNEQSDTTLLEHQNNILTKMKDQGYDYDKAIDSEIVGYRDLYGVIHESYAEAFNANPIETMPTPNGVTLSRRPPTMVTYHEYYGDDDQFLTQLKSVLTESQTNGFLGIGKKNILIFEGTETQTTLFNEINGNYSTLKDIEISRLNEISALKDKLDRVGDKISIEKSEIQKNYEDSLYINKSDFDEYSKYDANNTKIFNDVFNEADRVARLGESTILSVTDEEAAALISYIISNENGDSRFIDGGKIDTHNGRIQIKSSDGSFEKICGYLSTMDDAEKSIFNYILKQDGAEAAIKYLYNPDATKENIDELGLIYTRLDDRWLDDKIRKDTEWAQKNFWTGLGASAYSVVATPVEGISAAWNTYEALKNDTPILRKEVYSMGDTFRSAVSAEITENSGSVLGFVYDTGMSIADSLYMMAVNGALTVVTGGAGGVVLSTAVGLASSIGTMGSRVFVSSLNEGLDRGLSDEKAVLTAVVSAGIESAMEAVSLSHIIGLEKGVNALGKEIITSTGVESKIGVSAINLITSQISQALCEGDEEFWTEIANFYADRWINGDNSKYNQQVMTFMQQWLLDEHSSDPSYTLEDAKREALELCDGSNDLYNKARQAAYTDLMKNACMAWLGGAASGLVFGTHAGIVTNNVASSFAEYQLSGGTNTMSYSEAFIKGLEFNEMLANNRISLKSLLKDGFSLNTEIKIDGKNITLGTFLAEQIDKTGNRSKFQEFVSKLIPKLDDKLQNKKNETADLLTEFKNLVENNENSKAYDEKLKQIKNLDEFRNNLKELENNSAIEDGTIEEKIAKANDLLQSGNEFVIIKINDISELSKDNLSKLQNQKNVIIELKDGKKFALNDILEQTELNNDYYDNAVFVVNTGQSVDEKMDSVFYVLENTQDNVVVDISSLTELAEIAEKYGSQIDTSRIKLQMPDGTILDGSRIDYKILGKDSTGKSTILLSQYVINEYNKIIGNFAEDSRQYKSLVEKYNAYNNTVNSSEKINALLELKDVIYERLGNGTINKTESQTDFSKICSVLEVLSNSSMESANLFNDSKQFLHVKFGDILASLEYGSREYQELLNSFVEKFGSAQNANQISESELFNLVSPYLSEEELSNYNALKENSTQYTDIEKTFIYLYTKQLGPVLASYMRDAKTEFKGEIHDGTNIDYVFGRLTQILDGTIAVNSELRTQLESFEKLIGMPLKDRYNLTNEQRQNIIDNCVNLLQNIMDKSTPVNENITVYRGVNGVFLDNSELLSLSVGSRFNDSSILSTSVTESEISKSYPILLEIDVPAGSKAAYIESVSGTGLYRQQELWLPANSTFEVTSIQITEDGKQIVKCKMVESGEVDSSAKDNLIPRPNFNVSEMLNMKDTIGKDIGNQSSLYEKFKSLLKSKTSKEYLEEISDIIKQNHPDYTMKDIEKMLYDLKNHGCSYIAMANILLEQYNYDAEFFLENFGINIKNEDGSLNTERLTIDIFSYLYDKIQVSVNIPTYYYYDNFIEAAKDILNQEFENEDDAIVKLTLANTGYTSDGLSEDGSQLRFIKTEPTIVYGDGLQDIFKQVTGQDVEIKSKEDFYNHLKEFNMSYNSNIEGKHLGGKISPSFGDTSRLNNFMDLYLSSKSINLKTKAEDIKATSYNDLISEIQKALEEGYSIEVGAGTIELWMTTGKKWGGTDVDHHAMTFRGISKNGDFVVSSWGELYTIPKEFFGKELSFTKISFDTNVENSLSTNGMTANDAEYNAGEFRIFDKIQSVFRKDKSSTNSSITFAENENIEEKIYKANDLLQNGNEFVIVKINDESELTKDNISKLTNKDKVIIELKDGKKFALNDILEQTELNNDYYDNTVFVVNTGQSVVEKMDSVFYVLENTQDNVVVDISSLAELAEIAEKYGSGIDTSRIKLQMPNGTILDGSRIDYKILEKDSTGKSTLLLSQYVINEYNKIIGNFAEDSWQYKSLIEKYNAYNNAVNSNEKINALLGLKDVIYERLGNGTINKTGAQNDFSKICGVLEVLSNSSMESANLFNDSKQFLHAKFGDILTSLEYGSREYQELLNGFIEKFGSAQNANQINESELFDLVSPYLKEEELSNYNTLKENSTQYTDIEKTFIYLYTKQLGPVLASYMRDAKTEFKGEIHDGTNIDYVFGRLTQILDGTIAVNSELRKQLENFEKLIGMPLKDRYNLSSEKKQNIIDNCVSLLQNIMDKSAPVNENITVYRGVNGVFLDNSELLSLSVGSRFNDSSILSTSVTESEISKSYPILLEIDVPAGSKAAYIESVSGTGLYRQQELWLPANSIFEVTSIETTEDGKQIVKCKIVDENGIHNANINEEQTIIISGTTTLEKIRYANDLDNKENIIIPVIDNEEIGFWHFDALKNPNNVGFMLKSGTIITEQTLINEQKAKLKKLLIEYSKNGIHKQELKGKEVTKENFDMNDVVAKFFERNGYISKDMDISLTSLKVINNLLHDHSVSTNCRESTVCIGDIIGINGWGDNENVVEWMNTTYADPYTYNATGYNTRSNGILDYNLDELVDKLYLSFNTEPFLVLKDCDGNYYIHGNGQHRFSALKAAYLIELSNASTEIDKENIRKKYTIPVKLTELDTIKSYCYSLLANYGEGNYELYCTKDGNAQLYINGAEYILTDSELINYVKNNIDINKYNESIVYAAEGKPSFAKFLLDNFRELYETTENVEVLDVEPTDKNINISPEFLNNKTRLNINAFEEINDDSIDGTSVIGKFINKFDGRTGYIKETGTMLGIEHEDTNEFISTKIMRELGFLAADVDLITFGNGQDGWISYNLLQENEVAIDIEFGNILSMVNLEGLTNEQKINALLNSIDVALDNLIINDIAKTKLRLKSEIIQILFMDCILDNYDFKSDNIKIVYNTETGQFGHVMCYDYGVSLNKEATQRQNVFAFMSNVEVMRYLLKNYSSYLKNLVENIQFVLSNYNLSSMLNDFRLEGINKETIINRIVENVNAVNELAREIKELNNKSETNTNISLASAKEIEERLRLDSDDSTIDNVSELSEVDRLLKGTQTLNITEEELKDMSAYIGNNHRFINMLLNMTTKTLDESSSNGWVLDIARSSFLEDIKEFVNVYSILCKQNISNKGYSVYRGTSTNRANNNESSSFISTTTDKTMATSFVNPFNAAVIEYRVDGNVPSLNVEEFKKVYGLEGRNESEILLSPFVEIKDSGRSYSRDDITYYDKILTKKTLEAVSEEELRSLYEYVSTNYQEFFENLKLESELVDELDILYSRKSRTQASDFESIKLLEGKIEEKKGKYNEISESNEEFRTNLQRLIEGLCQKKENEIEDLKETNLTITPISYDSFLNMLYSNFGTSIKLTKLSNNNMNDFHNGVTKVSETRLDELSSFMKELFFEETESGIKLTDKASKYADLSILLGNVIGFANSQSNFSIEAILKAFVKYSVDNRFDFVRDAKTINDSIFMSESTQDS